MMDIDLTLRVLLTALTIAIVATFIRVVKGPSAADRVVALDILTTVGIAVAGIYAAISGHILFLDIAIVLALLSFISTVAAAYYIERKAQR